MVGMIQRKVRTGTDAINISGLLNPKKLENCKKLNAIKIVV